MESQDVDLLRRPTLVKTSVTKKRKSLSSDREKGKPRHEKPTPGAVQLDKLVKSSAKKHSASFSRQPRPNPLTVQEKLRQSFALAVSDSPPKSDTGSTGEKSLNSDIPYRKKKEFLRQERQSLTQPAPSESVPAQSPAPVIQESEFPEPEANPHIRRTFQALFGVDLSGNAPEPGLNVQKEADARAMSEPSTGPNSVGASQISGKFRADSGIFPADESIRVHPENQHAVAARSFSFAHPPVKNLNTSVLHDKEQFPERDPLLVEMKAPPPYPVDLIDPNKRHVSVSDARHHERRTLALIAKQKRGSGDPRMKDLLLQHYLPRSVRTPLTEDQMREKIQQITAGRAFPGIVYDEFGRRVTEPAIMGFDKEEEERKQVVQVPADVAPVELRKFKDVLEDILRLQFRKWSKLVQDEFPDDVYWKPDGNLAALVLAYFEACTKKGKKLSLKSFFMRKLPPVMWLRRHIVSLNISFNHFEAVPENVFSLRNLVVLKARNNPIATISDRIERLGSLRYLGLSFCMLSVIPETLFTLPSLEILDVSYNLLSSVPREIMQLRTLRVLNLSGNIMCDLPACMMRLPRLTSVLAADSYVTLTTGRRSVTTVARLGSLKELAADAYLSTRILDSHQSDSVPELPKDIMAFLGGAHTCEWCGGARFGLGHGLIKAESIKKLRFTTFMIRYQVCGQCCRNPYHVYNTQDLERHIAAGLKELERMERNEKEKREREEELKGIRKAIRRKENKKKRTSDT